MKIWLLSEHVWRGSGEIYIVPMNRIREERRYYAQMKEITEERRNYWFNKVWSSEMKENQN